MAIIGIVLSLTMILIILFQLFRQKKASLYLALVYLEAALYFVYTLIPVEALDVKLILAFCPMFFGIPALYLFTRQLVDEQNKRVIKHFLSFLVNVPLGMIMAVGYSQGDIHSNFIMIYMGGLISGQTVQMVIYGRLIFRLCRLQGQPGLWLRRINYAILGVYSVLLLLNWIYFFQEIIFDLTGMVLILPEESHWFTLSVAVMFFWTISLSVLWGFKWFHDFPETAAYGGRALASEEARAVINRAHLFLTKTDDLQPDEVNPRALAKAIDLPYYLLSQVINSEIKQSVSDFIHSYRVNRAKALLKTQRELTILDIAIKAGFQSKSTFNAIFKKTTTMTPREYREQC